MADDSTGTELRGVGGGSSSTGVVGVDVAVEADTVDVVAAAAAAATAAAALAEVDADEEDVNGAPIVVPSEANVLNAPVAPYVMALKPSSAVLGMMVTGRRRTLVNPARTFFLTWAGLEEARKVGSEMARSEAVW